MYCCMKTEDKLQKSSSFLNLILHRNSGRRTPGRLRNLKQEFTTAEEYSSLPGWTLCQAQTKLVLMPQPYTTLKSSLLFPNIIPS